MTVKVTNRPFRGYVFSRPISEHRVPQHIQNLVVRNYAQQNGLQFLLSATEYCMLDSHMMLEKVLGELDEIDGVILYSMFMLPANPDKRQAVFNKFAAHNAELHAAVEGLVVRSSADVEEWQRIFWIQETCRNIFYKDIEPWLA